MKAARIHKNGSSLLIDEVEVPRISAGEILVRVRAAGVCHTELHFLDGTIPIPGEALTLGHEIAGEVVSVGEGVKNLKKGDRVILNNCVPCNSCPQCLEGRVNLCDNLRQLGFSLDGGYAEFARTRSELAITLPENVSFEKGAALTCSGAACHHALFDIGNLTSKDTLLINGMGGVGFSALQIAKNVGAKCIAVDIVDEKLQIAKDQFGADHTINGRRESVPERVNEITRGRGVDMILELVGVPATMKYAIEILAKRGRLVFLGYSHSDFSASPLAMLLKEVTVLSAVGYTSSNLVSVRDLAASGKLNPLVVAKFRLSEVNEALNLLKAGTAVGRSVILFDP